MKGKIELEGKENLFFSSVKKRNKKELEKEKIELEKEKIELEKEKIE